MSDVFRDMSKPTRDVMDRMETYWKCQRTGKLVPAKHCIISGDIAISFESLNEVEREFLQVDEVIERVKEYQTRYYVDKEIAWAKDILDMIANASNQCEMVKNSIKGSRLATCAIAPNGLDFIDETVITSLESLRLSIQEVINTGRLEMAVREAHKDE